MAVEIEKKYRLDKERSDALSARIAAAGGEFLYERFEENHLFAGGPLDSGRGAILRIRVTDNSAFVTYKERAEGDGGLKKRIEFESEISAPDAVREIIEHLGCRLTLLYEKRRTAWRFASCEIALDELPFGRFLEIEGDGPQLLKVEQMLLIDPNSTETATYPRLTAMHGTNVGGVVEARFSHGESVLPIADH